MSDFKDIVDTDGLEPEDEARLRHVHELLVQAGPPPDLPPSLERTPEAAEAEIVQFPLLPARRWAVAGVVAATLAVIAFGGGYVFGHSKASPSALHVTRAVAMHGMGDSQAILRLAAHDGAGNWPMELEVTNLPVQQQRSAYYELWLTKHGKPAEPCGFFRMRGSKTTVRFTVPYGLKGVDGWVVTEQSHGERTPGPVVLTT
jgi:hypothetical protein